jgi:hypothetical protein
LAFSEYIAAQCIRCARSFWPGFLFGAHWAPEHDPENRFSEKIMLEQKTERDDDSNKRRHAPVFQVLEARSGKVGPGFPVRSRIHLARPEEEP